MTLTSRARRRSVRTTVPSSAGWAPSRACGSCTAPVMSASSSPLTGSPVASIVGDGQVAVDGEDVRRPVQRVEMGGAVLAPDVRLAGELVADPDPLVPV